MRSTDRHHGEPSKLQRQVKRFSTTETEEGRLAYRPSSVCPVILIKKPHKPLEGVVERQFEVILFL
jgi:hypothetical protein